MGAVCMYLKSLNLGDTCFMHELMEKKLTRLVQEIIYLLYVYEHGSTSTLFQLTCRSSGKETATNMCGPKTLPGPAPKSVIALPAPVPTRGTKQKKGKFKSYP